MEETRSSAPHDNRNPQASATAEATTVPKRRQKSAASSTQKAASGKNKAQKDHTELRLQAIQALVNLPEGGRFFLTFVTQEGQTETIDTWT